MKRLHRAGRRTPAITVGFVRLALATGRAAEAREAVRALENEPLAEEPDRSILLAEVYLELGERSQLSAVVDALSMFPESRAAVSARVRGLLALGRSKEAVAAAKSGLEPRPGDQEAILLLSEALLEAGSPAEAAELMTALVKRRPAGAQGQRTLAVLGRACLESRRYRDAERWAGELLSLDPDAPEALRLAASVDTALGKPSRALDRLDRLVRLRPDDRSAHLARLEALRASGRFDRYESEARAALKRWPREAQLRRDLGWALLEGKRVEEALGLAREAAAREGAQPADRELLAETLRAAGRSEEASVELRRLVALDSSPRARRSLVYTLLALGRADQALDAARGLPKTPEDTKLTAECYLALGRRREAIELLTALREPVPEVSRLLAQALLDDGKPGEALRAHAGEAPEDLALRAQCLLALGRPQPALELLARLEREAPDLVRPELRVRIFLATGRQAEARRIVEQLAAKPGTVAERRSLGWLMLDSGAAAGAAGVARGLLGADATAPDLEMAIEAFVRTKSWREAVAALHRLRKLAPSPAVELRLLQVLVAAGDRKSALPIARALAAAQPTAEVLRAYADVLLGLEMHEEALAPLERLVALKPGPDTLELLAVTQAKLLLTDRALATVECWRRLQPTAAGPALQRFSILAGAQRRPEAVDAAEAALRANLDRAQREQLEFDLFYLLAALGRRPQAIELGRRILTRPPAPAVHEVRRSVAYLLKEEGRPADAVSLYRPLIEAGSPKAEWVMEFVELLLAAGQRAEAIERLEALARAEKPGGPAHRRLLEVLASKRETWLQAREMARSMTESSLGEPDVVRSLVTAWNAMGRPEESRKVLREPWKIFGPRNAWLERSTAEYMLVAGRWKEGGETLARVASKDAEGKLSLTEARLGAPREVQGPAGDLLASVAPSALSTRPELAKRARDLRETFEATSLEADFQARSASDGLEASSALVRARGRPDGRTLVGAGLERLEIARGGLRRSGEVASVEYTRQLTRDAALTARLEAPVGIAGAAPVAGGVELLSTGNRHGDPVRVYAGRDHVRESPAAWARGLQSTTVKVTHERPRSGGALSTSYEARAEAIDDGVERWSLGGSARLRLHRRVEASVGSTLRDAAGSPDPQNLYFAPRDFASVQADASWRAAELGKLGDWTVRAGLHADRAQGSPARGTSANVRAEFPMGPRDSLELDLTRFDNSANRISGGNDAYLERSVRFLYRTRL